MAEELITVEEALERVLKSKIELKVEQVNIKDAVGRVLAEEIHADRDFPPFDRVMMDGIAISFDQYKKGQREFSITGLQAAGTIQDKLIDTKACIEVMTGAIAPQNTDTVIPYESLQIKNGVAKITSEYITKGKNIHKKATDRKKDEKLIEVGVRITPAEVGVLATVGKYEISVFCQPSIAIISTGDELVDIEDVPEGHQIRKSNSLTLLGALREEGLEADLFHLKDNKEEVEEKLRNILKNYQVLLLTGGVSKGKKDYIPEVLSELKAKTLFHRVAQRPGKPIFFGETDTSVIFGFPGNPVSAFICFYKFFKTWYRSLFNENEIDSYVLLQEDIEFEPRLTYFVQVKLSSDNEGRLWALPVSGHGSGDLANLLKADGFIELPAEKSSFTKGSSYPLIRFRF